MRVSRLIMGMPVFLEIVDPSAPPELYEAVFEYLNSTDERFSTYKEESEVQRINRGEIEEETYSTEMQEIFSLAAQIEQETDGYFSIHTPSGLIDPSGIVKGWAIRNAAELIRAAGFEDFYLEIGGDIQTHGMDATGNEWTLGIRNPFNSDEIVKVLYPRGKGVATSGNYIRGAHIYDPHTGETPSAFVSLTVIGPDVYDADCFATAAFAMNEQGLLFIEALPDFEAYAIDSQGTAFMTSGFEAYTAI